MSHDVTEQQKKRFKLQETAIVDISSSIEHIAKSIEAMSENYSEILKINKNVVTYLQKTEKCEKGMNQTAADTEDMVIEEEQ